ncbi:MAG: hypothetical protein RLY31_2501 [Bacteroidota bacterium]
MKKDLLRRLLAASMAVCCFPACRPVQNPPARPAYVLAIHGGAGTIRRTDMDAVREAAYRSALSRALDAGEAILSGGGKAMDAVEAVIVVLEDAPEFNAGIGAVFTHEGIVEHDAAVMDGASGAAGAVAGIRTVRNPVRAAVAVMEQSPHVLLTGRGAESFARSVGLDTVPNRFFHTEHRRKALQRALDAEVGLGALTNADRVDTKFGTVGCVAMDREGHLAAGTSTGGMTNKRWGRVGDAPLIGAGTWAEDATCAVSCTGHGEYFIRHAVAHDLAARLAYLREPLDKAAKEIVLGKLKAVGGEGGLIAVDAKGHLTMTFNSEGMYRGYVRPGERHIAIYREPAE